MLQKDALVYALNATIIYCDNQGAVALANNPESQARSKHIDIQWHYQREKLALQPDFTSTSVYIRADRGRIDKTVDKRRVFDLLKTASARRISSLEPVPTISLARTSIEEISITFLRPGHEGDVGVDRFWPPAQGGFGRRLFFAPAHGECGEQVEHAPM